MQTRKEIISTIEKLEYRLIRTTSLEKVKRIYKEIEQLERKLVDRL